MARKLEREEIIKRCKQLKPNYNILDVYRVIDNNNENKIRNRIWLKVECDKHHIYDVLFDNFKKADCPECRRLYMSELNKTYTIKEIEEQCKLKNLKWLNKEDIVNKTKKDHNNIFILQCLICEHILKCNITNLFSDRKCGICNNNLKKPLERVERELREVYGDEYKLSGEYNGSRELSLFLHNKCHNTFLASLSNLLNGKTACPYCSIGISIGEMKIKRFLDNNNIFYEPQKWFNDCRYKNPLPFDFAVFKDINKSNLICLIEFDGLQHFEPVEQYGGEIAFYKTIHNDNVKNNYCLDNNIKLIRIPYWDYQNIDNILSFELLSKENYLDAICIG